MVRRSVLVASLLAVGACRPAPIEPPSIVFPTVFTNIPSVVDLRFTVGGKPLENATFSLPFISDAGGFALTILPPTPLHEVFQLQIQAVSPTEIAETLIVTTSDAVYTVPVMAHVVNAPDCSGLVSPDDPCQVARPDPATRECVVETLPDGAPCQGQCSSTMTCHSGVCFPEAVQMCQLPSTPVSLDPVWMTPSSIGNNPPQLLDVFDEKGTQYHLQNQLGDAGFTLEFEMVGPDGSRQQASLGSGEISIGSVMLLGGNLILASRDLSPPVQARSTVDGSLVWSSSAVMPADGQNAMTAVNGGTQVVIVGDQIVTLDAATGMLLASSDSPDGGIPLRVGSDGHSRVWEVLRSSPRDPELVGSLASLDVTTNSLMFASGSIADPGNAVGEFATEGTTIISGVGIWVWPNPIQGLPFQDAPGLIGIVLRADGTALTLSSAQLGCPPVFFDILDPSLQHAMAHCALSVIGAQMVSLTADGGAVVFLQTGIGQFSLVVFGPDGTASGMFQLNGVDYNTDLFDITLVGTRLFVTTQSYFLAYDVPGLAAATHGWICHGGSPQRQFAPQ